MGPILYRLILKIYYSLVYLYTPFSPKARKFVVGRKNARKELKEFSRNNGPLIWFHCASLGEYEQAKPIIEACENQITGQILITFFSPSGYDIIKPKQDTHQVMYLPIDTPRNAKLFIKSIRPTIAIFIRYEFWYFYLKVLEKAQIPVLSVSSDFRPEQVFFRWYGQFYLNALKSINHFFVQDPDSQKLLKEQGIDRVTISGDTRFDRVKMILDNAEDIPNISEFRNDHRLFVIGSAWPADMELLYRLINENHELKFVIAPHELDEVFYKEMEKKIRKDILYYSKIHGNISEYSVMIIDTIGILSRLYRYADFAFVGGAMGPGVHNVLEPAVWSVPVIYGNRNYERWQEARALRDAGGGFPRGSDQEIIDLIRAFELNDKTYEKAGKAAGEFVAENSGATDIVVNYIIKVAQP